MSCGVGHRCSLDLALLWLWRRLAATGPIRPLAWEPLYATDVALKRQKTKKKKIYLICEYLLHGRHSARYFANIPSNPYSKAVRLVTLPPFHMLGN